MKRAPCRCGHAKSFHYAETYAPGKRRYPCRLEGCKCKDYTPVKPK